MLHTLLGGFKMKKLVLMILATTMFTVLVTGCVSKSDPITTPPSDGANAIVNPDAVASASPKESSDPSEIIKGLSEDGTWIFAVLSDVELTETLHVDGIFNDKDDSTNKVYRKFALYAQDADKNVTAEYTLTVPKIEVTTPEFTIVNGTVKGDIYVNEGATGFKLSNTTLDGNLIFASQDLLDAAVLGDGTVTGDTTIATAIDAVASASPKESSDPSEIIKGLSEDGTWIFAILSDVELTETLNVDGIFNDKDNSESKVYRKLALYAQDTDHNVTAEYKLTVPKVEVTTPEFTIVNGTLKGDIYVNEGATGFKLSNTTLDGNLIFENQDLLDASVLGEGLITGTTTVANK
jgi:hypothetical protein